ncbi:MAG: hypothetical protein QXW70_00145 [Candidatus Anstonellales archaeon]
MASTTMKALASIGRASVSLLGGGIIGYMLDQTGWSPEISVVCGIVSTMIIFFLLTKLSGSAGAD